MVTTPDKPPEQHLISEVEAASLLKLSRLGLRIEARTKRRIQATGSLWVGLQFEPSEVKRFKRETLPSIKAEQQVRIKSGALLPIKQWLKRGRKQSDSGSDGEED